MKIKSKAERITIIVCAGLTFLLLVWLIIRAVLPLPPENEITITKQKFLIETIEEPLYSAVYTDIMLLEDGNFACVFNYEDNNSFIDEENADDCYLYIITKTGEVLKKKKLQSDVWEEYAFDNGNFSVILNTEIGDKRIFTLCEYTPELELVSEKIFPEVVSPLSRPIYNNGKIYCGYGKTVHVLDSDLNIIQEYTIPEEETGKYVSFVQAADKTVFLFKPVYSEYGMDVLSYTLIDLVSGEETPVDLPYKSYFGAVTPYPGDSTYDFYSDLSSSNMAVIWFFLDDIYGDYWCGINRDGTIAKIMLGGNYEDSLYFREAVPVGDKRYFITYEEVDRTREFYLYECSAAYDD
ncbi:MAG: hypothetical protein LBL87_05595 [Ruminococcus sp.]|jgi:hypothetical protein|nr:hypothetical protein [Ruminococcus sp.]